MPEFIIAVDSQERIIGYNYPNFFLMGLGWLNFLIRILFQTDIVCRLNFSEEKLENAGIHNCSG